MDEITGGIETEWEKELKTEVTTGLTYRVAPGWYAVSRAAGRAFIPIGRIDCISETYAVFTGPAIHYSGGVGEQRVSPAQLLGKPSPGGSRALDEFEKRELGLKIGYNF